MDRQTYIEALKKELNGYSQDEIDSAIEYVNEYYDETENPEEVEKALGTPEKFAKQIKAERAIEREKKGESKGCGIGVLMAVIIGVLSLPISIPLVFILLAFVITIVVVVLGIVIALIGIGIAIPVAIIFVLGTGVGLIASQPALGFFMVGMAFVGIGVGIFVLLIIYWVIKFAVLMLIRLFTWIFNKIRGKSYEQVH